MSDESDAKIHIPISMECGVVESVNARTIDHHGNAVVFDKLNIVSEQSFQKTLYLEIKSSPDIIVQTRPINIVEKGKVIQVDVDSINYALSVDFRTLNSDVVETKIDISLSDGEDVLFRTSKTTVVQPVDMWQGLDVNKLSIVSFINPNCVIEDIFDVLGNLKKEGYNDQLINSSNEIYQQYSPTQIIGFVKVLLNHIVSKKLNYRHEVDDYKKYNRRVCSFDEFDDKVLSKLDIAVAIATFVQCIGANSLIVYADNNVVFPGLWLCNETLNDAYVADVNTISNLIKSGRIILIDVPTLLDAGDFNSARDVATSKTNKAKEICAIDVSRSLPIVEKSEFKIPNIVKDSNAEEIDSALRTNYSNVGRVERRTKMDLWETRLLNTQVKNNLINLHITSKKIPLMVPKSEEFAKGLCVGHIFRILLGKPNMWSDASFKLNNHELYPYDSEIEKIIESDYDGYYLRTPYTEEESLKRMRYLYREWRTNTEETGSNTLHAALDYVVWKDDEKKYYAPIVLIPLEIINEKKNEYKIRINGEPTLNETFIQKLKNDYSINVVVPDDLLDIDSVDLVKIRKFYRELIKVNDKDMRGWEVVSSVTLGCFSFNEYMLWKDLRDYRETILDNQIVEGLASNQLKLDCSPISKTVSNEILLTDSADGSQITAINAALDGRSFVLQGPPGTGKSQTITNIITNLLYHNKTVLFVAEKETALNVVYERLKSINLGRFCLELHSKKTDKGDFLKQLSNNLIDDTCRRQMMLTSSYETDKEDFKKYKDLLYSDSYFGLNLRELIGRYSFIDCSENRIAESQIDIKNLPVGFDNILHRILEGLNTDLNGLNIDSFPLSDSTLEAIEPGIIDDARGLIKELQNYLKTIDSDIESSLSNIKNDTIEDMTSSFRMLSGYNASCNEIINQFIENTKFIEKRESTSVADNEKTLLNRCYDSFLKVDDILVSDDDSSKEQFIETIREFDKLEETMMYDPYELWSADSLIKSGMKISELDAALGRMNPNPDVSFQYDISEYRTISVLLESVKNAVSVLIRSGISCDEAVDSKALESIVSSRSLFSNEIPDDYNNLFKNVENPGWMSRLDLLDDNALNRISSYIGSIDELENFIKLPQAFSEFRSWASDVMKSLVRYKEIEKSRFNEGSPLFVRDGSAIADKIMLQHSDGVILKLEEVLKRYSETSVSGDELNAICEDYVKLNTSKDIVLKTNLDESLLNSKNIFSTVKQLDGVEGSSISNHLAALNKLSSIINSSKRASDNIVLDSNIVESIRIIVNDAAEINEDHELLNMNSDSISFYKELNDNSLCLLKAINSLSGHIDLWDDSIFTISDSDFNNIVDNFDESTKGLMKGRKQKQSICNTRQIKNKNVDFNAIHESLICIQSSRPAIRAFMDLIKKTGNSSLRKFKENVLAEITKLVDDLSNKESLNIGKNADIIIANYKEISSYLKDLDKTKMDLGDILGSTNLDLSPDMVYYISGGLCDAHFKLKKWIPIRDERCRLVQDLTERGQHLSFLKTSIDKSIASTKDAIFGLNKIGLSTNSDFKALYLDGSFCSAHDTILTKLPELRNTLIESKKKYDGQVEEHLIKYNESKKQLAEVIKEFYQYSIRIQNHLSLIDTLDVVDKTAVIQQIKDGVVLEHRKTIEDYECKIKCMLQLSRETDGTREVTNRLIKDCVENLDRIPSWVRYNITANNLENNGFGAVNKLLRAGVSTTVAEQSFLKKAYRKAINAKLNKHKDLKGFLQGNFESQIKDFKKIDSDIIKWNQKEIYRALYDSASDARSKYHSQVTYLIKEKGKKRHSSSLRTMVTEMKDLIPALTPCLLMSPASVAQFIEPGIINFDYVIFDEASQIPTNMAVGAISRASNAIIVGDPNQLPPTSFFIRESEEEFEDDDSDETESVLDECMKLQMPRSNLMCHYRSAHESLIAFSNHEFYDDSLYTFPSPDDRTRKVNMIKVAGNYESGPSKRYNDLEAQALVKDLIKVLRDPNDKDSTIGVIAFGAPQRDRILHHLDLFLDDEHLNSEFIRRQCFVKNLENVQGDERDIIFFSVGYGRDKNGKMIARFGPVSRPGGWRRLNVAVTRARTEMRVYSSITKDDISVTNKGNESLHDFLEYAETGAVYSKIRPEKRSDLIADSIAFELSNKGYDSVRDVGKSDYRVDLAVVDPDCPSEYILAILTDGVSFMNTDDVRDRMFAHEDMLKRLHWNTEHVWALEWYFDREGTIKKLVRRIEDCRKVNEDRRAHIIGKLPDDSGSEKSGDGCIIYKQYEVADIKSEIKNENRFLSEKADEECYKLIDDILKVEAPLSEGDLNRKISNICGIALSRKVKDRIQGLLYTGGYPSTNILDARFIWSKDVSPSEYKEFRNTTGIIAPRPLFAYEEAINALKYNIGSANTVSELLKSTADMLGSGDTPSAVSALKQAYERGISEKIFSNDLPDE